MWMLLAIISGIMLCADAHIENACGWFTWLAWLAVWASIMVFSIVKAEQEAE